VADKPFVKAKIAFLALAALLAVAGGGRAAPPPRSPCG
jgi:hypothetical protein